VKRITIASRTEDRDIAGCSPRPSSRHAAVGMRETSVPSISQLNSLRKKLRSMQFGGGADEDLYIRTDN
jgi:hypothetical protein